jgi:serine/threonine protein kinase/Tfp pilus assembly protein PilF
MTDDEKDHKQVPSDTAAMATDVSDRVPAGQSDRRQSESERGGSGTSLLGEKVGSIRIVEYIGEGGFGEVYAGYDEKLDRKVALKALRSDRRLQAEARARFLREARMLSHLDHPNICRIYDLVAEKDRDFLILELLTGTSLGKTIKKGCSRTLKFKIAEQVARALAAAHEKGIVHRDLKPENVMITSDHDEVKVLDFGLARPFVVSMGTALDVPDAGPDQAKPSSDDLLATTLDLPNPGPNQVEPSGDDGGGEFGAYAGTRVGAVMGTPAYMSPEQARGEPATPASDIYSFGLLLQELFSGDRPVEEHLTVENAVVRAARGESRPFVDKDRDLTALVSRLKSLAPASRPSALDAADRLQWIAQKPRRLKLRFLAAGIAVILVATTTVAVFQGLRANRAAVRAERDAQTAKQVADFLVSIFQVSDPDEARGKTVTAREILDKGAKKIETELKDQPLVQATLMKTMGTVYMGLGLYKDAEPLLSAALATRERAFGPSHLDVAVSLNNLAGLYVTQGKYAEAEPLEKRALAIREAALGPDHPDVALILNDLAWLYLYQGKYPVAEPLFKRALAIEENALGPDHPDVSASLSNLAGLYWNQGKYAEAEPLLRRSLAIYEKAHGEDHPDVAISLNNLASLFSSQGKYAEAEPLFKRSLAIEEKALGKDHPTLASSLDNIAVVYANQGQYAEAAPLHLRSLAICEKALGPDHPDVAKSLNNLANLYKDQGQYVAAEPLYRRALAIYEKALGPDHPDVARSLYSLGALSVYQDKYSEAEPLLKRALAISEKALGPGSQQTADALRGLASCEFKEKRLNDALGRSVHCVEIGRELAAKTPENPKVHFLVGSALLLKGQIETAMGRGADAQSAWREALSFVEPAARAAGGVTDQSTYAQLLLCIGRTDEARPIVRKLLETGYRDPDLLALCHQKGLLLR